MHVIALFLFITNSDRHPRKPSVFSKNYLPISKFLFCLLLPPAMCRSTTAVSGSTASLQQQSNRRERFLHRVPCFHERAGVRGLPSGHHYSGPLPVRHGAERVLLQRGVRQRLRRRPGDVRVPRVLVGHDRLVRGRLDLQRQLHRGAHARPFGGQR